MPLAAFRKLGEAGGPAGPYARMRRQSTRAAPETCFVRVGITVKSMLSEHAPIGVAIQALADSAYQVNRAADLGSGIQEGGDV